MLCVEFPQAKYIDVSDITHVLKAAAVTNSEHLNSSMIFVASHFLSAKVSPPEWRLNLGFRTRNSVPFQGRSVHIRTYARAYS